MHSTIKIVIEVLSYHLPNLFGNAQNSFFDLMYVIINNNIIGGAWYNNFFKKIIIVKVCG